MLLFSPLLPKKVLGKHGISLSAYAGQNIRIAFKNNTNNKYQLWIDDIKVENIANAFDVFNDFSKCLQILNYRGDQFHLQPLLKIMVTRLSII